MLPPARQPWPPFLLGTAAASRRRSTGAQVPGASAAALAAAPERNLHAPRRFKVWHSAEPRAYPLVEVHGYT
jgi:hypothetical protein